LLNGGGSNATGVDPITDQLWLPTEWEMFGANIESHTYENASNQGRLGYYTDVDKREKEGVINSYWLASPSDGDYDNIFCRSYKGGLNKTHGYAQGGFAPAFCVK
jgi:hypothetical protein